MNIEKLNERFGSGSVTFSRGNGGLAKCKVKNINAEAEFYLQGAHVTRFQPLGSPPVLWMSGDSAFEKGKAIRGGVPICWPWFGPHSSDSSLPQHGFVRNCDWDVIQALEHADGDHEISLRLHSTATTRDVWPFEFQLTYKIRVSKQLTLDLTARNIGREAIPEVGCALHSYFQVDDIYGVELRGLNGRSYIDKTDDGLKKNQQGEIRIEEETDRIYLETEDEVTLVESNSDRRIIVAKTGSQSTVIWNPWKAKSKLLGDFPDDGFQTMVCIETANAGTDVRTIRAGDSHTVTQSITIQ